MTKLSPEEKASHAAARKAAEKAKLDAYITRVVDAAPPLTPEQFDLLSSIFRPTVTARERARKTELAAKVQEVVDAWPPQSTGSRTESQPFSTP